MGRATKQPILHQDKLAVPEKYLRFSTPATVAIYRAEKLKCNSLVEVGAGVGGQTLAFAKTCKNVLAIEIDKTKANILIQNLKKLKISNVKVILGDALSERILKEIKAFQPEIIFVDTDRPEQAERTISNIKPPVAKLMETFTKITPKIALEIPPLTKDTDETKANYSFEKEFISLTKQLNRLTLYFNSLKQNKTSAIALPSKEKIVFSGETIKNSDPIENYKYLYVIDPTIITADLLGELSGKFNSHILQLDKPIMLSNKELSSNFLTSYKILAICKNEQKKILESLKKLEAKSVVLRCKIQPEDYWKTRNFYENNLKGSKTINLFSSEKTNDAILAEEIH
jgi:hypothetical protein